MLSLIHINAVLHSTALSVLKKKTENSKYQKVNFAHNSWELFSCWVFRCFFPLNRQKWTYRNQNAMKKRKKKEDRYLWEKFHTKQSD